MHHLYFYPLCFTGNQTQGLTHARQMSATEPLTQPALLKTFILFGDSVLASGPRWSGTRDSSVSASRAVEMTCVLLLYLDLKDSLMLRF